MKNFRTILAELRKPKEVDIFKSRVKGINTVDMRDESWRGTAPELMAKFGFKQVGLGNYAQVYENPSYPYVIKLFMKDTAYLTYLNWAKKNQRNKFVPKIKGKVVKLTNYIMAVRLEKLDFKKRNAAVTDLVHMARDPEDFAEGITVYNTISNSDNDALALANLLGRHYNLRDIHYGNVAQRPNGQAVMVDPFYNYFSGGGFRIDPDDISRFKEIF